MQKCQPLQKPSRAGAIEMFDRIAPRYDRINDLISMGLHPWLRSFLSKEIHKENPIHLLDLATGTGDQLFTLLKKVPSIEKAIGVDLSTTMIEKAKEKLSLTPFSAKTTFLVRDALKTELPSEEFSHITLSFGIRNVMDVSSCFEECFRLLKPGGSLLILECTRPENRLIRPLYRFYLKSLLPHLGKWIVGERAPFDYLFETIWSFPQGEKFLALMEKSLFSHLSFKQLLFGTITLYKGQKKR